MLIWLVAVFILIIVILILVYLLTIRFKRHRLLQYERELIDFTIKMYLEYGEELDIIPDEKSKEKLIKALTSLKEKIKNIK